MAGKLPLHKIITDITSVASLSERSKRKYESAYKTFMDWRSLKNTESLSENLLLKYFKELAETNASASLWAYYSMLRSTLSIYDNVNIENYTSLRAFLRGKSKGYKPKKAKMFTQEEVDTFIREAPDVRYLAIKVALIMGVVGACRPHELHSMTIDDILDLETALLVTVPSTTRAGRQFKITGHFYEICKKYIDLRPFNVASPSFFLNYQKGKCTVQNIGIKKLGAMGRQIAVFLKLPNRDSGSRPQSLPLN